MQFLKRKLNHCLLYVNCLGLRLTGWRRVCIHKPSICSSPEAAGRQPAWWQKGDKVEVRKSSSPSTVGADRVLHVGGGGSDGKLLRRKWVESSPGPKSMHLKVLTLSISPPLIRSRYCSLCCFLWESRIISFILLTFCRSCWRDPLWPWMYVMKECNWS